MAMLAEAVVLRRGRSAGFEVGRVSLGRGRPKGEAMVRVLASLSLWCLLVGATDACLKGRRWRSGSVIRADARRCGLVSERE